jgi:hypothetical protein
VSSAVDGCFDGVVIVHLVLFSGGKKEKIPSEGKKADRAFHALFKKHYSSIVVGIWLRSHWAWNLFRFIVRILSIVKS